MLGFLAQRADDELLYSILARECRILGTSSGRMIDFSFGQPRLQQIHVGLPKRLAYFAARLPICNAEHCGESNQSLNDLIHRHTLLPYLSHFTEVDSFHILMSNLTAHHPRRGMRFRRTLGWRRHLAFCTACADEDITTLGIPAWRRTHQLPGVYVCPTHGMRLRQSAVPMGTTNRLVCCPPDASEGEPLDCPFDQETAFSLAVTSRRLLSRRIGSIEPNRIHAALKSLLSVQRWLTDTGKVSHGFEAAMTARFGEPGLRSISLQDWTRKGRITWIVGEQNGEPGVPPVPCLLLFQFLNADLSTVF